MSLVVAVVLGALQGLTEFLPISSTAHLRIAGEAMLGRDPGAAFTAVTQLGTLAAVLFYFRSDLLRIARTWLRGLWDTQARTAPEYRLGWYIGLGTIPIAVAGYLFRDQIETGARDLMIIALALIVLGIVLFVAEAVGRRDRGVDSLTLTDGLAIGGAQALALVPGVSRSGATLSAGLFLGLERAAAARYSFLLSVPAVVLSGLFELKDIGNLCGAGPLETAVATVVALVFGYLTIAGLLRFLSTHSTAVFVAYRIVLGLLVLALISAGTLQRRAPAPEHGSTCPAAAVRSAGAR